MSELKDLIEHIGKALVDMPEKVEVKEQVCEQSTLFVLDVDETDRGKVIGQKGRTAKAIRTILGAASTKLGRRSVLHIKE